MEERVHHDTTAIPGAGSHAPITCLIKLGNGARAPGGGRAHRHGQRAPTRAQPDSGCRMRTLLRPSGCAYPSLSTPRASGTAHTKGGRAHENVSSMRALLLVLLGSRADAAGLREERAYDNALVEPATLEPASPAKGGTSLMLIPPLAPCG